MPAAGRLFDQSAGFAIRLVMQYATEREFRHVLRLRNRIYRLYAYHGFKPTQEIAPDAAPGTTEREFLDTAYRLQTIKARLLPLFIRRIRAGALPVRRPVI